MLSVIIPVYKVEKWLDRCVESVVGQTYRDLEIILVDDGSPDRCPEMCDAWAARDSRVRTVHRENGGQSAARNSGLRTVRGEYVTFVDSDDWLAPDIYEHSMQLIEQHQADVVQFGLATATAPTAGTDATAAVQLIEGREPILQYYMDQSTRAAGGYSVCRCIFRCTDTHRHVLEERFREGKINEDMDWKFKVLGRCQRLVVSSKDGYFYFQESASTTRGGLRHKDYDLRDAADELYKLASRETYGTIAWLGQVKKARTAFSFLCKIAYYGISDPSIDRKQTIHALTKEHRGNLGVLLKAPLPISRKVLAVLFAIHYRLAAAVIKIGKRI